MILSACGLMCNECPFFGKECQGCKKVQGKTFWALEAMPNGICALYDCSVNKKGFQHCGNCSELPCKMFVDQKDPNSTEEEHLKSIGERVSALKKIS